MMPRAKATPRQRLTLPGAASDDEIRAEIVGRQKALAYEIAAGIERGELPSDPNVRLFAAQRLRIGADLLRADKPKRRGNPNFARKLPDDDMVAVLVGLEIAFGPDDSTAIKRIADRFDFADPFHVARIFRKRRAAVADFIAHGSLADRACAIRGNSV